MSQTSVGVDFTLETVQYKFATIIGELCGKPSILSQFAVWLDLRLAEYKLKGSICLDCSGLKPEPDWLHGLRQPVTVSTDTHANEYSQANVQSHHPESQHISPFPVSRSSALQVHEQQYPNMPDGETTQFQDTDIKQQFNYSGHSVSNEVIPLSFHPNLSHKSRQHRNKYLAKRQSMSVERGPSTPAKQSKSVVSLDTDDSNLNEPNPLNSSYTSRMTPVSVEKEFPLASSSVSTHSPSLEETHNTSGMFQRAEYLGSKDQGYSDKEDSGLDTDFLKSLGEEADQSSTETEKKATYDQTFGNLRGDLYSCPPKRVDRGSGKRRGIRTLEMWLKDEPFCETRPLEEIPVEVLDNYLAQFFSTIKQRNGSDYHYLSLNAVRSNLESHLHERGFPLSIVKSTEFRHSQDAYRIRYHKLKRMQTINKYLGAVGTSLQIRETPQ